MNKITQEALDILCAVEKRNTAIDFTCGHGFDTFHLAHQFRKVYAFDIQEEAIESTKEKCRYLNNIEYYLGTHENFDRYVRSFDVGIFNLGYLPHSDKQIVTDAETVIRTLEKALLYMHHEGRLVIVVYPGFASGKKESVQLEAFCEQLESKYYDVSKLSLLNRKDAPYILRIDKHNQD